MPAVLVDLELSFEELEALHKTVGIAITNLYAKASRTDPTSHAHAAARREASLLTNVQQQILDLMADDPTHRTD